MRKIIHVDMDCFSRQWKCATILHYVISRLPSAAARARGWISTANYPARGNTARSAMPTATALRLCPHLKLLPGRFYKEASRRFAPSLPAMPLIEPLSLDEAHRCHQQ